MKKTSDCREAFLALVRAGLWEECVSVSGERLAVIGTDVLRLAEEQSVVGLVAAGVEKFTVYGLPFTEKLKLLGKCQLIEHRNEAMNRFIAELVKRMREADIKVVLVKGQGVAQCYERPQWRSAGDIDLLLDDENYNKAKAFLSAFAEKAVAEDVGKKHLSVQIKGFTIELHDRMPFALSRRADRVVDEVVLVFTHFLHHFFIEGVGLKQICDWCRLLWTYRDELDKELLGKRLRGMGLMSEWKVFASLAVNRLGMPQEAMPFFDESLSYRRKANRALRRMMKSGNLGHNNDVSYRARHTAFLSNAITFFRRMADFAKFSLVFPMDSPRFFMTYVTGRIKNSLVA